MTDSLSAVRGGYDRWANVYDHDANPLPALEEPIVRAVLGEVRGLSVLDLGCGTGRHSLWLTARGAAVTAVDFSAGMLAEARTKRPVLTGCKELLLLLKHVSLSRFQRAQPLLFLNSVADPARKLIEADDVGDSCFRTCRRPAVARCAGEHFHAILDLIAFLQLQQFAAAADETLGLQVVAAAALARGIGVGEDDAVKELDLVVDAGLFENATIEVELANVLGRGYTFQP